MGNVSFATRRGHAREYSNVLYCASDLRGRLLQAAQDHLRIVTSLARDFQRMEMVRCVLQIVSVTGLGWNLCDTTTHLGQDQELA